MLMSALRLARPAGLRALVRPAAARPLVARMMSTVPTTLRNREEPQAETPRRGLASGAVSTVSAEKDTALEVRPKKSTKRGGQGSSLAAACLLAHAGANRRGLAGSARGAPGGALQLRPLGARRRDQSFCGLC